MGDENLTVFPSGFNPREALDATLQAALTSPSSLSPASLDVVVRALRCGGSDHERCRCALSTVGAILYARADLIDATLIDAIFDLATADPAGHDVVGQLKTLLGYLAKSSAAPRAWTRLSELLRDERSSTEARAFLLPLVGEFVAWREDLVGLDGVLTLAESLASAEQRTLLLDQGVDRFVFCAPEAFTVSRLKRMAPLFGHSSRYRYVLHFLAARRSLRPEVRTFLAQQLAGRFPFRETAAAILVDGPVKMLVVMNIALGQGDEVVRIAALLQALLDANPLLTITLIARRTYLYDNPRVTTVRIGDDAAVEAARAVRYDGFIEVFQPDRIEFAHRFGLHDEIEQALAASPPQLVIRAELGRADKAMLGIRSEFLYQTVELGGTDIAQVAGLDRVALQNIYEPCLRLLAELGLPQRVAEETPLTASLLTGNRSVDAERAWEELVARPDSASSRPVALVNPFGGAGATKGFYEQDATLAAEIRGLVDEGYLAIVLPNGTPWGRRATVLAVLSHLDPDTRACVRVAPDPAETDRGLQLDLPERGELDYADRVMRLFKYFATYADLVVTVEGWLAHLAYNLGRPFRLFLAAGSFTPDWFPYGRGQSQRLVTAFSTHSAAPNDDAALSRNGDLPLFPHQPRRELLRLALAGLVGPADLEIVAALRGALCSPDSNVREWVISALGRVAAADAKQELLAGLEDSDPNVMRESANALLDGNVDCSRELGSRYRELLKAHAGIAEQDWDAIAQLGSAALPLLFRAGRSGAYVIARQAREVLRQMLAPYVRDIPPEVAKQRSRDDRLMIGDVLRLALTSPAAIDPTSLDVVADALRLKPDDPLLCELALAALAALFYARPDLADRPMVERLADLLPTDPLPDRIDGMVAKLVEVLAAGPHAPYVWPRLSEVLLDQRVAAARRQRLLPLVGEFIQWHADMVGLDGILALAESPQLAGQRTFLLDHGVERFVFCEPEAFTVDRLQRIATAFGDLPRYRYVLYSLSARPTLEPEVRLFLERELADHFPHQEKAAATLKDRPVSIFVAMNLGMGQGDDVVRLAPLLQGLLDANPDLSITLVTWRTYLYDNPRVVTIPIADDTAIAAALARPVDGVIEFFQPESAGFTFRIEAHAAVESHLATHRPALLIKGDIGRACEGRDGNRFSFLHQTVELDGEDIAQSRGLDNSPLRNVYEPAMRLLAELGLPQRAAEQAPLTPSILTGTPSADAERVWAELVWDSSGQKRPVALVNPFGGTGMTKGFFEQNELIAAEVSGLVAEGYLVVFLPNAQKWGRRSNLLEVHSHLEPEIRPWVRVAPDPAETDEAAQLSLPERSTLSYADRVMRMFKYFATYADLIVTVEGWLAHFAYNLGRPFRLFLAAGSYSAEYHPRNRGRGQQVVTGFSPHARVPYHQSALLQEDDPPPVPHRPRKTLLELALPALGSSGGIEAVPLLRRALASPDADVRMWATIGLGRVAPAEASKADLLGGLRDKSPAVVREAADALLRESVDCARELGVRYRDVLQANADIVRHNWDAVARVGPIALPALFNAGESEVHDVREGAKELVRKMLGPYIPALSPAAPSGSRS